MCQTQLNPNNQGFLVMSFPLDDAVLGTDV